MNLHADEAFPSMPPHENEKKMKSIIKFVNGKKTVVLMESNDPNHVEATTNAERLSISTSSEPPAIEQPQDLAETKQKVTVIRYINGKKTLVEVDADEVERQKKEYHEAAKLKMAADKAKKAALALKEKKTKKPKKKKAEVVKEEKEEISIPEAPSKRVSSESVREEQKDTFSNVEAQISIPEAPSKRVSSESVKEEKKDTFPNVSKLISLDPSKEETQEKIYEVSKRVSESTETTTEGEEDDDFDDQDQNFSKWQKLVGTKQHKETMIKKKRNSGNIPLPPHPSISSPGILRKKVGKSSGRALSPKQMRQSFRLDDASIRNLTDMVDKKSVAANNVRWRKELVMEKRISLMRQSFAENMFYSEEDIANMKYEKFMEECGLEPNDF
jgi:hypothetical protein